MLVQAAKNWLPRFEVDEVRQDVMVQSAICEILIFACVYIEEILIRAQCSADPFPAARGPPLILA